MIWSISPFFSVTSCLGIKVHEGRVWNSSHRGRLWIHAAAKDPDEELIHQQLQIAGLLDEKGRIEFML